MEVQTQKNTVGCAGDNVDFILEIEVADKSPMSKDPSKDTPNLHPKDIKGKVLPRIELAAVHKLIDLLSSLDPSVSGISESYSRELTTILKKLLDQYSERKLQDFLRHHPVLRKCEHCGVIACAKSPESGMRSSRIARCSYSPNARRNTLKNNENSYVRTYQEKRRGQSISPDRHETKLTVEKETISRGVSPIEQKLQIDRFISAKLSGNVPDEWKQEEKRSSILPEDLLPIVDTMKYLIRGHYANSDEKEKPIEPNLVEKLRSKTMGYRRKDSFVLHGSRDEVPQPEPGFWLCGGSKPAVGTRPEVLVLAESRTNPRDVVTLTDSLQNCTENLPELRAEESDTTAFSTSTAENMIWQWIKKPSWKDDDRRQGSNHLERPTTHERVEEEDQEQRVQQLKYKKKMRRLEKALWNSDSEPQSLPESSNRRQGELFDGREDQLLVVMQNSSHHDGQDRVRIYEKAPDPDDDHHFLRRVKENSSSPEQKDSMFVPKNNSVEVEGNSSKEKTGKTLPTTCDKATSSTISYNEESDSHREYLNRVPRKITLDANSFKAFNKKKKGEDARIMSIYRKILESSQEMDWDGFEGLVESLHPDQKELWRDICRAISKEARRAALETGARTEVSIEIDPVPCAKRKNEGHSAGNEIVFELDMALNRSSSFLDEQLNNLTTIKSQQVTEKSSLSHSSAPRKSK